MCAVVVFPHHSFRWQCYSERMGNTNSNISSTVHRWLWRTGAPTPYVV